MISEKCIENSILSYLKLCGVLCWKNDSVGIYDPTRNVYRKRRSIHHLVGVSDILGIYKGRFLAIEVKSENGRLTPGQKRFIDSVNANGGIAFVAKCVEDVEYFLNNFKED